MKYTESCAVSGKFCVSPFGLGGEYGAVVCDYTTNNLGARLKCFACGEYVCENCSKMYDYYDYGRKIICDNCAEDHELVEVEYKFQILGGTYD